MVSIKHVTSLGLTTCDFSLKGLPPDKLSGDRTIDKMEEPFLRGDLIEIIATSLSTT